MSDNMKLYNAVRRPPAEALKTIQAGRLRGMSDIKPQWRYEVMTDQLGPCGLGWKYQITDRWTMECSDGQVLCFSEVYVFIKNGEEWSEPIPGVGGSKLVSKEQSGLFASDEGWKMAVTDAISTALQKLGVAADVYAGMWDGSKYREPSSKPTPEPQTKDEYYTNMNMTEAKSYRDKQLKQMGWTKRDKGYKELVKETLGDIPADIPLTKDQIVQIGRALEQLVDATLFPPEEKSDEPTHPAYGE